MIKNTKKILLLILTTLVGVSYTEVTYVPLKKAKGLWDADSLFLGAEVAVKDSTKPVIATWKPNQGDALGAIYFMVQNGSDSAFLLFHNHITEFSKESLDVNLGRFPRGTKLYFMYTVTDTSKLYNSIRNKKLFSGQNRNGIDPFISEKKGLIDFRWAIAGKIDEDYCEISFASTIHGSYRQMLIKLSNTYLVK